MKLRKLSAIGHNTAASYMSTLFHIDHEYASTFIYRLGLTRGLTSLEIHVLNASTQPAFDNAELLSSLVELKDKFLLLLEKESLPSDAVASYTLTIKLLGSARDIVDLQCEPTIVDLNGKLHSCAAVRERYLAPTKGVWP